LDEAVKFNTSELTSIAGEGVQLNNSIPPWQQVASSTGWQNP